MTQPPPTDPSNPFRPPPPEQGQGQHEPLGAQPQYGSPPQFGQPHYGQPQYGQPFGGQAQPPYGASYGGPSYGGPPPYPPQRETGTNGLAIASFVLGLIGIGLFLAVPFGFVALSQIHKRGQKGKGFAIAGLVLSLAWIVGIVAIVFAVVNAKADRNDSGEIVDSGFLTLDQLRTGDCIKDVDENVAVFTVPAVPCAEPHIGEVYAIFDLPGDGDFPGNSSVEADAEQECITRVSDYSPAALTDSSLAPFYWAPSEETWSSGDREVICLLLTSSPATGSILD